MDQEEFTQASHVNSARTGIYLNLEDDLKTSIQDALKMAEYTAIAESAFPGKESKALFDELNESLKHLKKSSRILNDIIAKIDKEL